VRRGDPEKPGYVYVYIQKCRPDDSDYVRHGHKNIKENETELVGDEGLPPRSSAKDRGSAASGEGNEQPENQ
jgi:hypothetical protein